MTLVEELADWASRLDLAAVPERVVCAARDQVLSQLAVLRAGMAHPLGGRIARAFAGSEPGDVKSRAYRLAAWSICLDFDDTMYAGHVSHSAVNVPIAYVGSLGLTGEAFLTSVIAANECAARVTAAATLGPFRGQTAAHTHLVGSVVARLRATRAPAAIWADALSLALSMPPWPLSAGFFGSDAKLLTAAIPVRIGLDACDAAEAGLAGPRAILEHPEGFLARFADVPLPDAAVARLGERWHTETLSCKPHPGSAYLNAAVDCAIELRTALAGVRAEDIEEVIVVGSLFTVLLEKTASSYRSGPQSAVAAVSFSVGYNVATALLTGALGPSDLAPGQLADARRWALAEKVRVQHDAELSMRALTATAPLGESLRQAGEQGRLWLLEQAHGMAGSLPAFGPPVDSFADATKSLGARVTVRLTDGRTYSAARAAAAGAAGHQAAGGRAAVAREKFLSSGGVPSAADQVMMVESMSGAELALMLDEALHRPEPSLSSD